jgi:peptidoglycan/LPS O-acetylase OafA/YrhL
VPGRQHGPQLTPYTARLLRAAAASRLPFIDALRGIAAMAVVGNHLYYKNLVPMGAATLPGPLHWIFANGHLGVPVFFVLSGFVIPYAIGKRVVTPRYAGTFVVRRSLRLDPAYWATIAFALLMLAVSARFMKGSLAEVVPFPSGAKIGAHLLYAQDLLGHGNIVGAFWTLCIEFQFYLSFIALLLVVHWLGARDPAVDPRIGWRHALLFAPLFLWSVAVNAQLLPDPLEGLFVQHWYAFCLGAALTWVVQRRMPEWVFFACLALVLAAAIAAPTDRAITALATASVIWGVWRAGKLGAWTLGRPLQFLGAISYSLYLIHIDVGSRAVRVLARYLAPQDRLWATVVVLLAGIAASTVAAYVLYRLVERPTVRLSTRLRERWEKQPAPVAAPADERAAA